MLHHKRDKGNVWLDASSEWSIQVFFFDDKMHGKIVFVERGRRAGDSFYFWFSTPQNETFTFFLHQYCNAVHEKAKWYVSRAFQTASKCRSYKHTTRSHAYTSITPFAFSNVSGSWSELILMCDALYSQNGTHFKFVTKYRNKRCMHILASSLLSSLAKPHCCTPTHANSNHFRTPNQQRRPTTCACETPA